MSRKTLHQQRRGALRTPLRHPQNINTDIKRYLINCSCYNGFMFATALFLQFSRPFLEKPFSFRPAWSYFLVDLSSRGIKPAVCFFLAGLCPCRIRPAYFFWLAYAESDPRIFLAGPCRIRPACFLAGVCRIRPAYFFGWLMPLPSQTRGFVFGLT